jgi:hypothetical protein
MSEPTSSPADVPAARTIFPSVDVVFDLARDEQAAQRAQSSSLDTKAGLLLTSASLLIIVLTIPHAVPAASQHPILAQLPAVGFGAYILVVIMAAFTFWPRRFWAVNDLDVLFDTYLDKPEDFTRGVVANTVRYFTARNLRVIRLKQVSIFAAFAALLLEVLVIVTLFFLQTIT